MRLDFPAHDGILKYISNQGCPMRPQKLRRITAEPCCRRFFPETGSDAPAMRLGLDMLEALRLADAEGLSQEEAARQMEISPPTFCRLLAEARRRVAQALTRGLPLVVEGGPVRLRRPDHAGDQGYHGGHGQQCDGATRTPGTAEQAEAPCSPARPCGGHGFGYGRRRRTSA
ncbi:DUF134 domain-containing protein [Desulfovibrio piger]|uniref:DUF134 domain-containing protein n=1 Tax=Desulfovibrio piger TaxID=901 RepID=UPI003A93486E